MNIIMSKFKSVYNEDNIFYALPDPLQKRIEGELYIEVTPSIPNVKPHWVKRVALKEAGKVVVNV